MKRLYYVTNNLDNVDRIAEDLHRAGILDWNFHVLSKDVDGLYKHHINSARVWQESDLVHTALRGTLLGLTLGIGLGYLINNLIDFGHVAILVPSFLGLLFGTWAGGFIGLSLESYKIRSYHDQIEAGKHLLMVDVKKDEVARVKAIMQRLHPEAPISGQDTTLINPFRNKPAIG